MKYRMRCIGAALASVLLACSGCTWTWPWQRDWGGSTHSSSFFVPERSSFPGTSQGSLAEPTPAAPATGASAANPVSAATESVTKAFKSVSTKVSSAFEVKPKVIPAYDPAKLSSQPERLSPALYVQAAQLSENQGAIANARQQYEKALALDPRDVNTLIAVARFHDRQGEPERALQRYEQARDLAPTNTLVWNDLGLFHARRGNLDASLEALQQAVRLDPRNVRYRNNLAAALIESKRVSEAIDALRTVHPEATALFNAACLLSLKNEPQQAAGLLEQSLRIDPSLVAARQMLQELRGPEASLPLPEGPAADEGFGPLNAPAPPDLETARFYRTGPPSWPPAALGPGSEWAAPPQKLPAVR